MLVNAETAGLCRLFSHHSVTNMAARRQCSVVSVDYLMTGSLNAIVCAAGVVVVVVAAVGCGSGMLGLVDWFVLTWREDVCVWCW